MDYQDGEIPSESSQKNMNMWGKLRLHLLLRTEGQSGGGSKEPSAEERLTPGTFKPL